MAETIEHERVFENEEWLVTGAGLEHKDTGYFIARRGLGDRRPDGLWSWPPHMAETRWCTPAPFTEAFARAAAVYGMAPDLDFARSFHAARREVGIFPPRSDLRLPAVRAVLQDAQATPISRAAESRDRASPGSLREPASRRERVSASSRRAAWPVARWRRSRPIRRASIRLARLLRSALYGT